MSVEKNVGNGILLRAIIIITTYLWWRPTTRTISSSSRWSCEPVCVTASPRYPTDRRPRSFWCKFSRRTRVDPKRNSTICPAARWPSGAACFRRCPGKRRRMNNRVNVSRAHEIRVGLLNRGRNKTVAPSFIAQIRRSPRFIARPIIRRHGVEDTVFRTNTESPNPPRSRVRRSTFGDELAY